MLMTEDSTTLIWCLLIGYVVISVLNMVVLSHVDDTEHPRSMLILFINIFPGVNLLVSLYMIYKVIAYLIPILEPKPKNRSSIKDEYHKEVPSIYDVYRGFPGIAISMMYKSKYGLD